MFNFMKDFLTQVLDFSLHKHKDLSSVAFVLPSNRAGVIFKKKLALRISKPIWSPKIYSIQDFISAISEKNKINNTLALLELYKAYSKTFKTEESFDEFYIWGSQLLNDFYDIDQNLVDPKKIFNFLYEAKRIDSWNLNVNVSSKAQESIDFWKKIEKLYHVYTSNLISLGLANKGMNYKIAAEKVEDKCNNWVENFEFSHLYFAGLNALNKAEKKIINSFLNTSKATTLWDIDKKILNNPLHEAGNFIRSNVKYLNIKKFNWNNNFYSKKQKIEICSTSSNIAQAKLMGNILNKLSETSNNISNTAVVLPDETLLAPVLRSIPDSIKKYNITMGLPVFQSSIASLIMQILNTLENTQKLNIGNNEIKFYYKDVVSILCHPLISDFSTTSTENILKSINKKNIVFFSKKQIEQESNIEKSIIKLIFIEKFITTKQIIKSLLNIIDFIKKNLRNSVEEESAYQISKALIQLKNLLVNYPYIGSISTLKKFILQLFKIEKINFRGEPVEGLQIMGLLETRALDFENIIILSVNEQVLPEGKTNTSFIPYDIKMKYGIPTFKDRDGVFSYHFYRLLQRAKNIFLIYNTDNEKLNSGEKSRFISQIENEWSNISHTTYISNVIPTKNTIIINKDEIVLSKIQSFSESGISPTAIKTYLNCSLQFYFDYILKLKIREEIDEHIGSNILGTAIHETLEHFYLKLKNKMIVEEDIKKISVEFPELLKSKFKILMGNTSIKHGKNRLAFEVAKRYINRFLKEEKKHLKSNNVFIKEVEKEIKISINIEKKNINLKGKIDRIDIYDNTTRIIDYKTGSIKKEQLNVTENKNLFEPKIKSEGIQLLMYSYIYLKINKNEKIQSGIIGFREIKNWLQKLKYKKEENFSINDLEEFEESLVTLIKEIYNPMIPFKQTANIDNCKHCPYKTICTRIQ